MTIKKLCLLPDVAILVTKLDNAGLKSAGKLKLPSFPTIIINDFFSDKPRFNR